MKDILIPPTLTVREAISRLNSTGKKILLVVDEDERLIGTITDGDIRRAILKGMSMDTPVDRVMNISPKYLREGFGKDEAVSLFQKYKIDRIPVVDESGKIRSLLFIEDFIGGKKEYVVDVPVVIMAGGKGTRLDPFTKILPKPLIPLGDKPILQVIMERFYHQGFGKFILTLGYKAEVIKLWLADMDFPFDIEYVIEDEPLGTAGGLRLVVDEFNVDGDFIVSNCDILLDVDFHSVISFHRRYGAGATVVGYFLQNRLPYGVIETEGEYLKSIKEKPYIDALINTGVYVINSSVVKKHVNRNKYLDMPELLEKIRFSGGQVAVYPHHGEFFDTGQWELYRETLRRMGY